LNDTRADLRRHHASYQADWKPSGTVASGDQLATLLVDWDGERATQGDRLALTEARHARDNFGVSAQHQLMWRRAFVTLSGRIERNDSFGTAAVPRASLVYVLRDGGALLGETRLRASGGTGIKEPTLLESFSVSPYFRGNPDLEPERSRSLEVGIDQRLAGNRAKIEVAWFANRFSDIISVRTNPATFEAQYFNVGVTRARGLELGVQAAPAPALRVRAGYTWLASRIVATTAPGNPLFARGQWAFRRPRHSGTVGATLQWKRVAADLDGVMIGRFADSDFGLFDPPLVENPGHTTWDARVALTLTPRLTGLAAIDNLTDRDYSEPLGYQPLRRAVRAGLRVGF
jgi:vitamin B12 transporter